MKLSKVRTICKTLRRATTNSKSERERSKSARNTSGARFPNKTKKKSESQEEISTLLQTSTFFSPKLFVLYKCVNTNTEPSPPPPSLFGAQATAFRVFLFDLHQYTHHHQITLTKKALFDWKFAKAVVICEEICDCFRLLAPGVCDSDSCLVSYCFGFA